MPVREKWRAARGFPGYRVSDRGRVRSVDRTLRDGRTAGGVVLVQAPDADGYLRVTLRRRGRAVTVPVHLLVAEAYLGPCPDGQEVRHGPAGQQENGRANLSYGTHQENERDKRRGRGKGQDQDGSGVGSRPRSVDSAVSRGRGRP